MDVQVGDTILTKKPHPVLSQYCAWGWIFVYAVQNAGVKLCSRA